MSWRVVESVSSSQPLRRVKVVMSRGSACGNEHWISGTYWNEMPCSTMQLASGCDCTAGAFAVGIARDGSTVGSKFWIGAGAPALPAAASSARSDCGRIREGARRQLREARADQFEGIAAANKLRGDARSCKAQIGVEAACLLDLLAIVRHAIVHALLPASAMLR